MWLHDHNVCVPCDVAVRGGAEDNGKRVVKVCLLYENPLCEMDEECTQQRSVELWHCERQQPPEGQPISCLVSMSTSGAVSPTEQTYLLLPVGWHLPS